MGRSLGSRVWDDEARVHDLVFVAPLKNMQRSVEAEGLRLGVGVQLNQNPETIRQVSNCPPSRRP